MFNVIFERPLANVQQFVNSLKAHPAVKAVYNGAIVTAEQLPPQPPQQKSTGITQVDGILSAAKSGDGVGNVDVDIAVIDTGVSPHPDLNVFRCISFLGFFPLPICNDGWNHGTKVAGVAAAIDNNIGVAGTATFLY
jgi:subtilisin